MSTVHLAWQYSAKGVPSYCSQRIVQCRKKVSNSVLVHTISVQKPWGSTSIICCNLQHWKSCLTFKHDQSRMKLATINDATNKVFFIGLIACCQCMVHVTCPATRSVEWTIVWCDCPFASNSFQLIVISISQGSAGDRGAEGRRGTTGGTVSILHKFTYICCLPLWHAGISFISAIVLEIFSWILNFFLQSWNL
jgi:hypothetical protein